MVISSSKPPPLLRSHRSLPNWVINSHCLTRNRLTTVNYSSIVSSMLVANHITVTQPLRSPCSSLAMNDHVVMPHLHCCKIIISPLPLHHGATHFVLSVAVALYPYFPLCALLFSIFCFHCVIFFSFLVLGKVSMATPLLMEGKKARGRERVGAKEEAKSRTRS